MLLAVCAARDSQTLRILLSLSQLWLEVPSMGPGAPVLVGDGATKLCFLFGRLQVPHKGHFPFNL